MKLAIIYARSRNYCIGKDGGLPWDLPDEFAFFESSTRGHPVIMGRRSYEDHESLLPGRLNIVISRSRSEFADGVVVANSLKSAIAIAKAEDDIAFIIGGAGLMAEAFPRVSMVFESVINAEIDGDVFIEAFDFTGWETERVMTHEPDADHRFGFISQVHRRQD